MVTKAKGSLKFRDIIWTPKDFKSRIKQLRALDEKFKELENDLKQSTSRIDLARLIVAQMPTTDTGGLILGDFLSPQAPESPRSGH